MIVEFLTTDVKDNCEFALLLINIFKFKAAITSNVKESTATNAKKRELILFVLFGKSFVSSFFWRVTDPWWVVGQRC